MEGFVLLIFPISVLGLAPNFNMYLLTVKDVLNIIHRFIDIKLARFNFGKVKDVIYKR